MIQAQADKPRQLLRIRFSQHVGPEEVRSYSETVRALVAELQPGFRLLTDLSQLVSMDVACVPHIGRMMDLFRENGVAEVVRVIPNPQKDIGFNILSVFHYSRDVRIVTCESLAEATKLFS
jgi:hypothetical protein